MNYLPQVAWVHQSLQYPRQIFPIEQLLESLEMRVVTIYDDEREEIAYVSTCGSKAVK